MSISVVSPGARSQARRLRAATTPFLIQTAVPEPTTAALFALGLLALPRRRRTH